jgi:hypothetical protein
MKLFAMLFLSVFLGKSCSSQTKNDLKTAVLEYTANTRGFYQKIVIQNQMVRISKERGDTGIEEEIKISNADWMELVSYFETIDLNSLATLKAPTEKRTYDGAAIANLKIVYQGKTYGTASFDHGYPPEAIKKLVDKINSFAKKQK